MTAAPKMLRFTSAAYNWYTLFEDPLFGESLLASVNIRQCLVPR